MDVSRPGVSTNQATDPPATPHSSAKQARRYSQQPASMGELGREGVIARAQGPCAVYDTQYLISTRLDSNTRIQERRKAEYNDLDYFAKGKNRWSSVTGSRTNHGGSGRCSSAYREKSPVVADERAASAAVLKAPCCVASCVRIHDMEFKYKIHSTSVGTLVRSPPLCYHLTCGRSK